MDQDARDKRQQELEQSFSELNMLIARCHATVEESRKIVAGSRVHLLDLQRNIRDNSN